MNKKEMKPSVMENQFMRRVHVGTSDSKALDYYLSRFKRGAVQNRISGRDLFYAAARAIIQHHNNVEEYQWVMGGLR